MTHDDAGHYAAKHPEGTKLDPQIKQKLQEKNIDGNVSCAASHAIAYELDVAPEDVGIAIDLMEMRIHKCRLGLFGYQPEKRIVKPVADPSGEVEKAVKARLVNGRISCKTCWEIAEQLGKKKLDVSNACEKMGIKVNKCQLGAF
jgi:hypothetical protein